MKELNPEGEENGTKEVLKVPLEWVKQAKQVTSLGRNLGENVGIMLKNIPSYSCIESLYVMYRNFYFTKMLSLILGFLISIFL